MVGAAAGSAAPLRVAPVWVTVGSDRVVDNRHRIFLPGIGQDAGIKAPDRHGSATWGRPVSRISPGTGNTGRTSRDLICTYAGSTGVPVDPSVLGRPVLDRWGSRGRRFKSCRPDQHQAR